MAGLLSGILPYVYSQSDRLKRNVNGLLSDPRGTLEQTAGGLLDAHRGQQNLLAQAFSDPGQPFKMTDPAAMEAAAMNMLAGPLGVAPMGMTSKYVDFTSGKYAPDITMDEVRAIMDVPTVEKMRMALDAAGDDAFQNMVQQQYKAYRPKTADQESMLVESVLNQIVAKMRR